ncbi:MAG: DUF1697 domain-containing protein [Spirochaetaceae bacterium]|nr:DUF1697 domain-containing protein [Spirochaetaceae bacterium]
MSFGYDPEARGAGGGRRASVRDRPGRGPVAMSERYLALLRGINVGGNNIIAKNDLRRCFEDLGFTNVRTYIQSGNIVFRARSGEKQQLTARVEAGLSERFSYAARAVVLSYADYRALLDAAPPAWGEDPAYRHNALFTLAGTTPADVLASIPPVKEELETVAAGPGVVFWSADKKRVTRSAFVKLPAHPIYQQVTIRNHNTVRRLATLLEET